MKRFLFTIILGLFTLGSFAQENITLFFLNDGSFNGFYDDEIDSIVYSHLDMDSIWHNDAVVQEIWMNDSVVRIPIESIDSICHKLPDPVYKPGVIRIDESYLSFVSSVDGMTVTLSPDIPVSLRPHVGDTYYYDGLSDLFPEGLAGRVKTIDGDKVTFEQVEIPDIFDRFVFFGRYVLASNDDETEPKYSVRRVQNRNSEGPGGGGSHAWGDEPDYGIDNWRMGDGSGMIIDSIHESVKIPFRKIHAMLKAEITMNPVITVEYAYDGYYKNRMLFFKSTIEGDYELKYGAGLLFDDEEPYEPSHFWGSDIPKWKEFALDKIFDDDEENAQSIYLIDVSAPIPQFPLLQVGFKLGLFVKTSFEGELFAGVKETGSIYKSLIYRYDKKNGHDITFYNPTKESTNEFFLEGSASASIWAGLTCGVNVSLGATKEVASISEDLRFRIGPYIEGDIKADISSGMTDRSVYTLLKDTEVKTGMKHGLDLSLNVSCFGETKTWTQKEWMPDKLLFQQDYYLYPLFEAPEYTTSGNSLTCTSKVSRVTFPNNIGFALLDENGDEVARKGHDWLYAGPGSNKEFSVTATFDNLDFANHRYTIVPYTCPFDFKAFQVDLPDAYRTTVLCPDSHHPHLIDLGLPSGTKWLCQNLLADAPEEAGGYYQWGKPYRTFTYTDLTYSQPYIRKDNYQGMGYDAATTEFGSDFATPTLSQFDELFRECKSEYKQNAWGGTMFGSNEGIYLKGQNGANLYLPFAGYKEGSKVNSDKMGHYVLSDVEYSNGKAVNNILQMSGNGNSTNDAGYAGYSLRPVSLRVAELSFAQQKIDFEEVNVGMTANRQIVVTNEGNVPQTIVVSDAYTPFSVFPDHVGTHILQPGEVYCIFVTFSPKSAKDYYSVVNIRYRSDESWTITRIPIAGKGIEESSYVTVDLGLSVMWASFNVGATDFDDYGEYYSWGETQEKMSYYWSTYKYCNGSSTTLTKYNTDPEKGAVDGLTVLDSDDDIAQVNWGGNWRLPTKEEQQELRSNCTWTLTTTRSGVKGYMVTSNKPGFTDRAIFLPLAGYSIGSTVKNDRFYGYYLSGSLDPNAPERAWVLTADPTRNYELNQYRYLGFSARPVMPCLKLSCSETVLLFEGDSQTINIETGSGRYKCVVDDNSVVSAQQNGNAITLNALRVGSAIIYLTDTNSGQTAHIYVKVHATPVAIDLGLPSGTKWASFNIGADKPEDYGYYYAWGEVETKNSYGWDNYEHCDGTKETCHDIGSEISGTQYDVAHVKWGGDWQMPTADQINELVNNCQHEITTVNGVTGTLVTGPNGNTIFLPCAGFMSGNTLYHPNEYGLYKSGSRCNDDLMEAWLLNADADAFVRIGIWNSTGHSVRAVCASESTPVRPNGSDNGHEYIDLGLSVRWATCNIGANKPEDSGKYYSWGETEAGTPYSWSGYLYCVSSKYQHELTKYCDDADYGYNGYVDNKTVLDPEDDVAYLKWGGNWRIPSSSEIRELIHNCTWTWTELNGVEGCKVTSNIPGYTDRYIFLPAAGYVKGSTIEDKGSMCTYTSNTINYAPDRTLNLVYIKKDQFAYSCSDDRYYGNSVRPVCAMESNFDEIAVATIELNYDEVNLEVGDSLKITVVTKNKAGDVIPADVRWTSTNVMVAKASDGCSILAIGSGVCTITAYVGGIKTTCKVTVTPNGTENGYEYVDLGLSVKWATCNVGASSPKGYGNYYAWGETETKSEYTLETYKYCKGSENTYTKYCDDSECGYNGYVDNETTLSSSDDVANVKWGGTWHIPTYSEFEELLDEKNCEWIRTTEKGVDGFRITSKIPGYEGRSIFLPYAGTYDELGFREDWCDYWASSLDPIDPSFAGELLLGSREPQMSCCWRHMGLTVRPVCK